ncbi:MAG TPA: phosphotransferase family protein, partial [Hyphomicrobiaceae bacterium]|nr:phosphotransferase family protein [Hyphomicrobiaceae bacterium]
AVIGAPFLIQAFLHGEAQGHKLVRDPDLVEWGAPLAASLGVELAKIHAIRPGRGVLDSLPVPAASPAKIEVGKFRQVISTAAEGRPALEYILAWLDRNAPPPPAQISLVHGDFRTGNYLVQDGQLSAILDWEFTHWGDADEDLGWFCAKCWRFGMTDLEAGGIAERAAFYQSYERYAARTIDPTRVHYWEIMAAAKWATIAVLQGDRFRKGGEQSIELALTGLMASELELEALDGLTVYDRTRT